VEGRVVVICVVDSLIVEGIVVGSGVVLGVPLVVWNVGVGVVDVTVTVEARGVEVGARGKVGIIRLIVAQVVVVGRKVAV